MSEVEGWYPEPELKRLREVAEAAPPGCFVEVGVYKGRSARVLASYGRKLYLYDNFELEGADYEHWPKGVWRCLDPCNTPPPPGVALLHHDAAHDHETVLRHLEHFRDSIVPGGFVVLHDWCRKYPGVKEAWNDFSGKKEYTLWIKEHTLRAFKKHGGHTQKSSG